MNWLASILGGSALDSVGKLAGRFFGNKEAREEAAADQQGKVLDEFSSENMQIRENRTWFDSFVDGLNRLPRPIGFFLTVWLFIWPLFFLESFLKAMDAYKSFPEWIGWLITSVWSLYFGGRLISKDLNFQAGSGKKIEEILASQKAIHQAFASQGSLEDQGAQEVAPGATTLADPYKMVPGRLSNEEFHKALDSPKPMSLEAIVEWNRRKQEAK